MTRTTLFRQMAMDATHPLQDFDVPPAAPARNVEQDDARDIYVWFEDTSERRNDGLRGIAGLPESLFPVAPGMRVLERHYAEGHPHLLAAMRVRCNERTSEHIAAIYTAALAVGTIAWIGSGSQYALAWNALYAQADADPQ